MGKEEIMEEKKYKIYISSDWSKCDWFGVFVAVLTVIFIEPPIHIYLGIKSKIIGGPAVIKNK